MLDANVNWLLPLVAGAVSFLSPCVLALVPGYLSVISGVALQDLRRGVPNRGGRVLGRALLFFTGFAVVFVLLGASASAVGAALNAHRPLLNKLFGLVIIAMGLHLLGLLRIDALYRERRIALKGDRTGPYAPILAGMAFAFAWTPCVGPILASILLYAGAVATVKTGAALLAVYAVGLGVPFLLTGVAFTRALELLRALRGVGAALERISGAVLVGIGALLVTNRIFVFSIAAQRLFSRLGLDLWRFF